VYLGAAMAGALISFVITPMHVVKVNIRIIANDSLDESQLPVFIIIVTEIFPAY
jgi:hypothetical protein